ncbi:response regulator transcription factor [Ramlibacter sp. AW1]|uniref:Response regulator transcription factor n=1 Tax=Ramlibacter aurantiacus TaxID=2801330 RepID=A0A936ZMU9_9BURK|nr:response regulator transcription factor [Ramlibacter aurantiacus]MBL0419111.1 response regulator transcription factor [Ramlibacter aurantiacus]
MRILLVEDDPMIGQALVDALRDAGHATDWLRDGASADTALRTGSFDAVVLDLGLPQRDGLQVLQSLRARGDRVPVLVATARDAVADRIAGLDAGADDYLVKPFETDELLARLRALIRRSAGAAGPAYVHGRIALNPATREASLDGRPVQLSSREWAVLEPMLLRPGAVFSRSQLEEKLYGWREDISSNAVEVYIHGLRKKLGSDAVQTVRGLGYLVPRENGGGR